MYTCAYVLCIRRKKIATSYASMIKKTVLYENMAIDFRKKMRPLIHVYIFIQKIDWKPIEGLWNMFY